MEDIVSEYIVGKGKKETVAIIKPILEYGRK